MVTPNNIHTIDGERFVGLNIRGFSALEVVTEILLCCLAHKYSLFSTIKERCFYLRKKTFAILLKTVKTRKFSPANLSPFMVHQN